MAKWAGKLEDDIKGFHLEVNLEPCHDTDTRSVTHSVDIYVFVGARFREVS